jgi:hypothetical protein
MTETLSAILYPIILIILWMLWTFFSDTSCNHGKLVAFLLPLGLILFPVMIVIFYIAKFISFPVFVLLGRKQEYEKSVEKVKKIFRPF